MRLAWMTDIHLDFVDDAAVHALGRSAREVDADLVLVTGDLSVADRLTDHLDQLAAAFGGPLAFVLGNHDFYGGSLAEVRDRVAAHCRGRADLVRLDQGVVRPLAEGVALVGVDGWSDGRAGDWETSSVMLNDYLQIAELRDALAGGKAALGARLAAEGQREAARLEVALEQGFEQADHLVVATHVPPFVGACWYQGKTADDEWAPHFTCASTGEVLRAALEARPGQRATVLCGHTHNPGVYRPLPNLEVRTGGAEYREPAIVEVLDF